MKKIKLISVVAIGLISLSTMVSCSSVDDTIEDLQPIQDVAQPHTCKMTLNGSKSDYSDAQKSRADLVWQEGDKIYLTFTVGTGTSYGDATYNNGAWTVNYYGSLTEGVSTKCNAVYFDNPQFASSSVVQLGESTGIYEDANAKYVFADGALSVTANLSPKVGRIRFAGENNDSITVYGITHYTSYDVSNGKYTQSLGAVKKKITNNYTPYIYGVFTDSSQPRLNVITKVSGFTRMPSSSIMQAGQSGYMSVPTESSHNGWQNSVILKVNGVEFSMIPVEYSEGNFLLAETELTSELYVAIVGSGYSTNLQRPAYARYSTFSTFLSKLNALTELNFRFPTYNEWLFAAKGGNKSQNYTYSGSNIIANVAWYEGNSNNSYHDVKQLQPNELGFYDMSGNAAEYVLLGSTTYTSYYYNMGGSYASYDSNCKSTSYQTESYDQSNYGLRIALSNN